MLIKRVVIITEHLEVKLHIVFVILNSKDFSLKVMQVTSAHKSLASPGHMAQSDGLGPQGAFLPCAHKATSVQFWVYVQRSCQT